MLLNKGTFIFLWTWKCQSGDILCSVRLFTFFWGKLLKPAIRKTLIAHPNIFVHCQYFKLLILSIDLTWESRCQWNRILHKSSWHENAPCKEAMVKYIIKNMKNGTGIRWAKYINSWKNWNSFFYDIYSFFFCRRLIYLRLVLFQYLDLFKKCWIIAVIFGLFIQQDSLPSLTLAFLDQGFKDNI